MEKVSVPKMVPESLPVLFRGMGDHARLHWTKLRDVLLQLAHLADEDNELVQRTSVLSLYTKVYGASLTAFLVTRGPGL